jgi:hypothetical protein
VIVSGAGGCQSGWREGLVLLYREVARTVNNHTYRKVKENVSSTEPTENERSKSDNQSNKWALSSSQTGEKYNLTYITSHTEGSKEKM